MLENKFVTIAADRLFEPQIESIGDKSMTDRDLGKGLYPTSKVVEIIKIEVVPRIYFESTSGSMLCSSGKTLDHRLHFSFEKSGGVRLCVELHSTASGIRSSGNVIEVRANEY